ncbi:MAG: polysaccharide pyruvyl transferase family protein, partial [Elusimicrobiaceae bacterium]|nr:polysaccharide pyruvyl transferase family protein [Elusimicrobiaceae bacterium]
MSSTFKPFLVNSNFCYTQAECSELSSFLQNVGFNTGNSYIAYAIHQILFGRIVPLPEIKNLFLWDFSDEEKRIEQINASHSHVLFALQDQIRLELSYHIRPDWERLNHFLEKLKKPFIVFSLGANAFPGDPADWYTRLQPDFVRFLHILSAHSVSLDVRGEETVDILKKLGITNAVPAGCPSYFETGPNRRIEKKKLTAQDKALGADSLSVVLQDEQSLIEFLYFTSPDIKPL